MFTGRSPLPFTCVAECQEAEERGGEVVGADGFFGGVFAVLVGGAVDEAAFIEAMPPRESP
jgi:hypothetical protein